MRSVRNPEPTRFGSESATGEMHGLLNERLTIDQMLTDRPSIDQEGREAEKVYDWGWGWGGGGVRGQARIIAHNLQFTKCPPCGNCSTTRPPPFSGPRLPCSSYAHAH